MSSTEETLKRTVREFLRNHSLDCGAPLAVAYSGGPDSTALLYLLAELRAVHGCPLQALFVDHGLRPEAERSGEEALAVRSARTLSVSLKRLHLPRGWLESRAAEEGGTEAAARHARYRFLCRCAAESTAAVLLAHTLDDQMETQVMRFFQGAGPQGLRGIPERRPPFYRPLLTVSKDQLLRYLEERGARYSTDSSNLQDQYLRNRVRRELMPAVRRLFPGVERSLQELSHKMRSCAEKDSLHEQSSEGHGRRSIDAATFDAAKGGEREAMLYGLWDALHPGEELRLPHRFVREACSELSGPGAAHRRATRQVEGHGIRLRRRGGRIICETLRGRSEPEWSFLELMSDKTVLLPDGRRLRIERSDLLETADAGEADETSVMVYTSEEYAPMILRSRREGDSIRLTGGSKKLKQLCRDMQTDSSSSRRYPVLEDRRGILALLRPDDISASVIGVLGSGEIPNAYGFRIRHA
jgi:tRNA(Ile)-lysidine synthase